MGHRPVLHYIFIIVPPGCVQHGRRLEDKIIGLYSLGTSLRNSLKYVASKDQKQFMTELKPVYRADNEGQALDELAKLKEKWEKKYPMVIGSWENNWPKLSTYFKYPAGIRKLIYTTNTIEGYHRQIRKVTKNKGVFTSDPIKYVGEEIKWSAIAERLHMAFLQPRMKFNSLPGLKNAITPKPGMGKGKKRGRGL
jgi:hypothetical protein